VIAAGIALAALGPAGPAGLALRLAGSVVAGLTIVRMFIVYHDHMHGTILRDSLAARAILYPFAILVMAPPRVWRDTHRYHHAHTAKIDGSHIGSYEMATVAMWARMSRGERIAYRIGRHPLTILAGYFTVFMYGMCILPILRAPRRNWDSGLALAVNAALSALLLRAGGLPLFALAFFLPLAISMALGAYIFYAQHNAPDLHIQHGGEAWSFTRAALESSSFLETGPLMGWFTGNIGYHHVHHLNAHIPFYRLPEAMAAIPALQRPRVTTLSPSDIAATFRLKLWDEESGRLVGFPD
jgi:omega-6 fatty acid desaturase (delta-12 desaturase)